MYDKTPLVPKSDSGVVQAVLTGRVSTTHQDIESINASHAEDEKELRQLWSGPIEIHRFGERGSGWKLNRQSIKAVEELIKTGRIDVLIMRDLGRAYRNPEFQFRIAHLCKDHGTRLICPRDGLDTAHPQWEIYLQTAVLRHGMTVPETRNRVRTKATHDFHRGGMVQKVLPGYRKRTRGEAQSSNGVLMEKLEEFAPIVHEMRTRVHEGQSAEKIARWLKAKGVAPGPYATSGEWTGKLVLQFLRNPILYGRRRFRTFQYEIVYATGEHRRVWNPNPEVEDVPELAFFSKAEFEAMNEILDNAKLVNGKRPPGRKNVARKESHFPGQHLICSICGDQLYWCGRDLKCQNAFSGRPQSCWCRLQVEGALLRQKLLPLLLKEIEKRPALNAALIDSAWAAFQRTLMERNSEQLSLEAQIKTLAAEVSKATSLLLRAPDSESLFARHQIAEAKLRGVRNELKRVMTRAGTEVMYRSREDVAANVQAAVLELAESSYEFAAVLRKAFPDLKLVPVVAVGTSQVRPRVRLRLPPDPDNQCDAVDLVVDAFEYSIPVRFAARCAQLKADNPSWTLTQLGNALGISKKSAHDTLRYSEVLKAAGVVDPFLEITERPPDASRWTLPLVDEVPDAEQENPDDTTSEP